MIRLRSVGTVVAFATVLALGPACGGLSRELPPLANAHPSSASLARAVLDGIAARDITVLRALALTESEFRGHVWPELPAARPERNVPFGYAWGDLRQKSERSLARTLGRHGGRDYRLVSVSYEGETTRYDTFLVHRDTTLVVRDDAGAEQAIRLYGSTLEQAGSFKVFSYVVED